jgi:hypothetical protein
MCMWNQNFFCLPRRDPSCLEEKATTTKGAMGEFSDSNDYEYSTSDDDAEYSWIGWFCSRKGHEFLCEVSAGGK